jgi:hypothetical protein
MLTFEFFNTEMLYLIVNPESCRKLDFLFSQHFQILAFLTENFSHGIKSANQLQWFKITNQECLRPALGVLTVGWTSLELKTPGGPFLWGGLKST